MVWGKERLWLFDEVKFESEIEQHFLETRALSPYKLFRATRCQSELKDQKGKNFYSI